MDTIQYLLKTVLILIPTIILFGVLYWLGTKLVVFLPTSVNVKSSQGLLPPPGSLSLGLPPIPSTTTNELKYTNYFNGYGSETDTNTTYAYFDDKGNIIYKKGIQGPATQTKTIINNYDRNLYIRNLSIYENGNIYTGLTFTGEAKNTMFNNGTFPILIADNFGRVIGVEKATAQDTWSVPGWTRFSVKINGNLPQKTQCSLIFRAEKGSPLESSKVFISIPETCY